VKSHRTAFPALALIVALVSVAIVPVYAGQVRPGCTPALETHDCCTTPVLKACCFDSSDASNPGAPVQSRVQVNPHFTVTAVFVAVDLSPAVRAVAADQTALRGGPGDLPTLLSTLLL
jgi:hypothetical protein